jgi:hypothetical protein
MSHTTPIQHYALIMELPLRFASGTPPPFELRLWIGSLRSLAASFGLPLRSLRSLVVALSPLSLISFPLRSQSNARKGLRKPKFTPSPQTPLRIYSKLGGLLKQGPRPTLRYLVLRVQGPRPKPSHYLYSPPSVASLLPPPLRGGRRND